MSALLGCERMWFAAKLIAKISPLWMVLAQAAFGRFWQRAARPDLPTFSDASQPDLLISRSGGRRSPNL